MSANSLRRVVYSGSLSESSESVPIAVTRENNGDAVYRVVEGERPALIGWSFEPFKAVDAALAKWSLTAHPRDRQNRRIEDTATTPMADLKWVIYRLVLPGERTLLVTREANGYLLSCYDGKPETAWVYEMYPNSTAAIDALAEKNRQRF